MKFQDMGLHPSIAKALQKMNFETPTEIQAAAIPVAIQGKDILGSAQTGTGKTAAFAIPLVQRLIENPEATALVLLPTRELAQQVEQVIRDLTFFARDIRSVSLIGGVSMVPQFKLLRMNPRIVVATPGRLIDHLERGSVSLAKTDYLVLDEADRMLDMGFAPQLREIVQRLPEKRQNLLFSATFPSTLIKLVREFMEEPTRISVKAEQVSPDRIKQKVLEVKQDQKAQTLLQEIDTRQGTLLVFVRTQRNTEKIGNFLVDSGCEVSIIHGGRSQAQRSRALQQFRDGLTRILVATDVAARGLDVPHVEHVVNYDLPEVPEDYVHRIGRTGRNGRSGEAVSFVTPGDRGQWRIIERLMNPHLKPRDESRFQSDRSLNKEPSKRTPFGAKKGGPGGPKTGGFKGGGLKSGPKKFDKGPRRDSQNEKRSFGGRPEATAPARFGGRRPSKSQGSRA
ncbi:MAG: DEAD/DEAH box helicase [Bdellovibrionaceae bacterium]|nr:DEAD/DEAH box helicase [Pseudobdellovibrionaceae bacterium]